MKKGRYIVIGLLAFTFIIGAAYLRYPRIELISESVVTELGKSINLDVSAYVKGNVSRVEMDLSNVNNQKTGEYIAHITKGSKVLELNIEVADTTPPTATVIDNLEYVTYENVNAVDLVTDVKDASNAISITFDDGEESHIYSEGGEMKETIVLRDDSGNISDLIVVFHVIADTTKPVLEGMKSLTVYQCDNVDYKKGVKASDDRDGDLTNAIKIDTGKLDLKLPGRYTIVYSVSDRSGNVTKKETNVTVMKDKAPVIKGVKDKMIYINETINYLDGVRAEDDRDGNLTSKIQVNSKKMDVTKVGTYEVIYTVIDNTGNKTVITSTVTVKKKEKVSSEDSKTSTEKNSTKLNNDTKQDSSGGFKFFDVEAESGPDVNGDVPASGEHVGTWG